MILDAAPEIFYFYFQFSILLLEASQFIVLLFQDSAFERDRLQLAYQGQVLSFYAFKDLLNLFNSET